MLSSHDQLNCLSPCMFNRKPSAHLEMFSVYSIRRRAGGLFIWSASMFSIHLAIRKSRVVRPRCFQLAELTGDSSQISFVLSSKTTLFSPLGINYRVLWRLSSVSFNKTSGKLQHCTFRQAFLTPLGMEMSVESHLKCKPGNTFEAPHTVGC